VVVEVAHIQQEQQILVKQVAVVEAVVGKLVQAVPELQVKDMLAEHL
jgi:hypothetical protein